MTRALAIASLLAAASPLAAQFSVNAMLTFTPTWEEVNGNSNGLLEPGESARIRIGISMTPAVGTVLQYTPSGGGTATGTVRGFSSAMFDFSFSGAGGGLIQNSGSTGGIANGVRPEWNLVGPAGNGTVVQDRLTYIQIAQFPFNSLPFDPITNPNGVREENPILSAFVATWTPASYQARTVAAEVLHAMTEGGVAVLVQTGSDPTNPPTFVRCPWTPLSVSIPVVPGPGTLASAGAAGLVMASRRPRRRHGR